MSNDTDYELEFSHGDKKYLTEAINWLNKKEPSWGFDIVVKPRKMTGMNYYYAKATTWANENASNMTIEDEINELHKLYSEIEVGGTFEDEYGKGSFYGEKDYEEYWNDEEDDDE
jgi:hypothetical protein